MDREKLDSLMLLAEEIDDSLPRRRRPEHIPYPELPKGARNAVARQWKSLLWSIDNAEQHGKHALQGLTVALARVIIGEGLQGLILNAQESYKPPLDIPDLLWNEDLPLNKAGQSMRQLAVKLPRTISVELNETAVFPSPWERSRFHGALQKLGPGREWGPWKQDRRNHFSFAWRPWPVVWVHNGNHSTMAALVRGGGKLKCTETFYFAPVLKAVNTDGVNWSRADTGSVIEKVRSLPMAGIFVIGQRLLAFKRRR
ncbi:DUF6710 family protein [Azohydromonas aeria]|uniref:DUF6710 family protein n=1 Tax=Azohydromonas aeria TaxID=2590212 RepID=UPI0012FC0239|nr:DUF6710 family protein [Azohydromonas aeria]